MTTDSVDCVDPAGSTDKAPGEDVGTERPHDPGLEVRNGEVGLPFPPTTPPSSQLSPRPTSSQERGRVRGEDPLAADRLPPVATKPPPVPHKSRLTVVGTVYFQAPDGEPTHADCRGSRFLESDEAPYKRQVRVGQEWKEVDLGWLKGLPLSRLVLTNDGARSTGVTPTEFERAEEAKRGVRVAVKVSPEPAGARDMHSPPKVSRPDLVEFALIAPGDSLPFEPSPESLPSGIFIRCLHGETRVSIAAFPT